MNLPVCGNFEVGETVRLVSVNKAQPEKQINAKDTEMINLK